MKKLMFVVACALAGVLSAATYDLRGVNVYDYKASVKHVYLKEKSFKTVMSFISSKTYEIEKLISDLYGDQKLYVKYTKSASLKGYLVQDVAGALAITNDSRIATVDSRGARIRAITGADPQPGNRCFLVVQNKSAEKAYRVPRIIPGVIDAKWYDPAMNGSKSAPCEGYLFLGGEVVARTKDATAAVGYETYDGFRGTKFSWDYDGICYSNIYPEAETAFLGRMFFDQQRNPLIANDYASKKYTSAWWDAMTNCMPWVARVITADRQCNETRTCDFGIDDYFFTSCYLFGKYNQPTRNGSQDIAEFADCWLNGAGIGKAELVKGKIVAGCVKSGSTLPSFMVKSLNGNLKAGIYLCTENGEDENRSMDLNRTGLFEDQFWSSIRDNSYAYFNINAETDDIYAWYRRNIVPEDGDVASHTWMVKRDIWADGNLDLRTTDVGYGTWSIKLNTNFAKKLSTTGLSALDLAYISAWGFKDPTAWSETNTDSNGQYGTLNLLIAIKNAQLLLDKDAQLFGNPINDPQVVKPGMINFSFYWNYLAEGYGDCWVNPHADGAPWMK